MRAARRERAELRLDRRRRARTARCRTRSRATSPIERGTLVTFDIGALLDGYCSDCTRTVAVGEPGERAREIYAIVLAAQLARARRRSRRASPAARPTRRRAR